MPNARPQYKPFFKGGQTGREITILNQSNNQIALASTVHRNEALTLQDTIYGSCRTECIRPGDSGRITLAEGQTAVYAWLTRNHKGPIPDNAYPDAAAIFNADGELAHEIHDRTALRLQKTGTPGLFWLVTPHYITVKNTSDQPMWYQAVFTTDSTVSRQNGKFNSSTARKLDANSETNVLLLGDSNNTVFYAWLGSGDNLPLNGAVADMAVLVQNSNGAIVAADVDASLVFEAENGTWSVNTTGQSSSSGVSEWVWIVLIVVAVVILLILLYRWASPGDNDSTAMMTYDF